MPKSQSGSLSTRTRSITLAALVSASLIVSLAACTGDTSEAAPSPSATLQDGGEIVIGAEQEPDCVDWISTCAGSIWGSYIMQVPTIPSVFQTRLVDDVWTAEPSDLVTGEPETVIADGKQTITYNINPEAVWSDGTPITSADFAYTALQIRDGGDVFDKSGYDKIETIGTSDPHVAVVTLNSPYAGWRTLFSVYGVLPAHLLEGQDRSAIMTDGYDFSGGPWKIESWERGTSATLVPNDNYWGEKPHLDKVTFMFLPDTTAAFQALKSGQVDVLYPSPQLDAITQIDAGLPGINSQVDSRSGSLEALWMNNETFPFDSTAVRQAIAYSLDREAIVSRLFGSLGIEHAQQSFNTPIVGAYAAEEFERYTQNLDEVAKLMEGDGWAQNADGIWEKDGAAASFEILTLAGNKRRDLTTQVIQSQLAEAGFEMSIASVTPADLFGTIAPEGDFQAGLWSIVDTFPDPTLSASFSSVNIPSEANGYSGINFFRTTIPELDTLLAQIDSEVDLDSRIELSKQADAIIADNVPSLPIDTVPNVLLWSEQVGGPLEINPVEGPFWNLAAWGLVG